MEVEQLMNMSVDGLAFDVKDFLQDTVEYVDNGELVRYRLYEDVWDYHKKAKIIEECRKNGETFVNCVKKLKEEEKETEEKAAAKKDKEEADKKAKEEAEKKEKELKEQVNKIEACELGNNLAEYRLKQWNDLKTDDINTIQKKSENSDKIRTEFEKYYENAIKDVDITYFNKFINGPGLDHPDCIKEKMKEYQEKEEEKLKIIDENISLENDRLQKTRDTEVMIEVKKKKININMLVVAVVVGLIVLYFFMKKK